MRSILVSMIALFASIAAVQAETNSDPIDLAVSWDLSLDANGHVVSLQPVPNVRADRVPQIREQLEHAIHEWRFVPGSANGHPAATQTRLFVDISVLPNGGDTFRIRVNHARTGGWLTHITPPKYPKSAITSHHQGKVIVRMQYDGDGKVAAADLNDSSADIDPALVQAAIDNARQWTFKPEIVDGHGVSGSVLTPYCFTLQTARSRKPSDKCKWSTSGKHDDLAEGETFALNPAVKLETDVEGKFL